MMRGGVRGTLAKTRTPFARSGPRRPQSPQSWAARRPMRPASSSAAAGQPRVKTTSNRNAESTQKCALISDVSLMMCTYIKGVAYDVHLNQWFDCVSLKCTHIRGAFNDAQ